MLKNKQMQSGFTLIELMVVVGIIAILAAIAYPSYQNFIIRGRIEAARSEMVDNIRMMENHYAKNRTMCGGKEGTATNDDGSCKTMPEPIVKADEEYYDTKIQTDKFSGGSSNNYIIVSLPDESKFSSNTLNNKEVYLLYYSNGSGYVKCTAAGYNAALSAKEGSTAGSGCSMM